MEVRGSGGFGQADLGLFCQGRQPRGTDVAFPEIIEIARLPVRIPDAVLPLPRHLLERGAFTEIAREQLPQSLADELLRVRRIASFQGLRQRVEVEAVSAGVVVNFHQQMVDSRLEWQTRLVLVRAEAASRIIGQYQLPVDPDAHAVVAAKVGHDGHVVIRRDGPVEVGGSVGAGLQSMSDAVPEVGFGPPL